MTRAEERRRIDVQDGHLEGLEACKSRYFRLLSCQIEPDEGPKKYASTRHRGIGYAFIGIMFLIIISGTFALSSALTLAFMALRAPEAYETENGLQVIRRIQKQRVNPRLSGALAQAR